MANDTIRQQASELQAEQQELLRLIKNLKEDAVKIKNKSLSVMDKVPKKLKEELIEVSSKLMIITQRFNYLIQRIEDINKQPTGDKP